VAWAWSIGSAMLPAIHEEKRCNIHFDIYIPNLKETHVLYTECELLVDYFNSIGISVLRKIPDNNQYDVIYSAYEDLFNDPEYLRKGKYHVRYAYGASGGTKPYGFMPSRFYIYDYHLCLSTMQKSFTDGLGKTYLIGNIKLSNYKRTRITPIGKKTILYLPTWGRDSSICSGIINKLMELRCNYYITAKMHSHTAFLKQEQKQSNLFDIFDKVYESNTPIADILNDADIVLSDISSVALDAIAGDVPLALAGLGEPIYFGGKLCLHQQLVHDDIIPGTNNMNELESIIEKAISPEYYDKQQRLKKELFPFEGQQCLDSFMSFQNDLFNDYVDPWYIAGRRAIRENYIKEQAANKKRHETDFEEYKQSYDQDRKTYIKAYEDDKAAYIKAYEDDKTAYIKAYEDDKMAIILSYKNSISWKITKPIRAIESLIINR